MNSIALQLKKGYTTGTCAQAAAKAAAVMLTTGKMLESVEVEIACGNVLNIVLCDQEITPEYARCAVIKDSGDDPDITHGAKIVAEVRPASKAGILIKGGIGIGRVTRPGLPVSVGEYAINPVPRKMIVRELSPYLAYFQGIEVVISVPRGEKLAKQTFNPRLGIEGGISILGTTGIVEPKSLSAYQASLSLQLDVIKASGSIRVALVPGYVGEKFCKEALGIKDDIIVKSGDHIGFMFEECAKKGIKEVVFAGHIGKLVKVANGQFNTHCRHGDGRLET
ncbi:cobalamin biosynthesis protein CbiD, partial [bacterium]